MKASQVATELNRLKHLADTKILPARRRQSVTDADLFECFIEHFNEVIDALTHHEALRASAHELWEVVKRRDAEIEQLRADLAKAAKS